MQTQLAVPISATDFEKARGQIETAVKAGAGIVELRVDYLENLTPEMTTKLIEEVRKTAAKIPIIVTCRDKKQGGARKFPLDFRVEIIRTAIKAGAEFVDMEFDNFISSPVVSEIIRSAMASSPKTRLILSAHDFEKPFDDIRKLHRHMLNVYSAAIPKLVYQANHINDCFQAFDLLHHTSGDRIIFCMGEDGFISRLLAKKLGSFLTFASLDDASSTAPGQATLEKFKSLYRCARIDENTRLFGVIADPVGHSLSPAIHNACFESIGANDLYLPLLIKGSTEEFFRFMDNVISRKWLDFKGFSVTIPHKTNALEYAKANFGHIDSVADKIKAVNTLLITGDGNIKAYNTDCDGALDSITTTLKTDRSYFKDLKTAVIGAGGVARGIVAGLTDAAADVTIYNRTVEKAQKLALEFGCQSSGLDELENLDAKLVINCTSIGMAPDIDASPVPQEYLKRGMVVFDTVYNPKQTMLLEQAKKKRIKRIDGVQMFINQAAAQFKYFTNKEPDTKLMHDIVTKNLQNT